MKLGEGFTLRDPTGKLIPVLLCSRLADDVGSVSMDLVRISIQSAFVQDIYTKNTSLESFSKC
jgi:hypothetical protein